MNIRFGARHITLVVASILAVGLPFTSKAGSVRAGEYQPIHVVTKSSLVAGQPLPLDIQLQGPATVHVYSDPAGAVSYDGSINGTEGTVNATTSTTPSGNVTVYVETDGEQVVSTYATASGNGGPLGIQH